jgi:hypothetical protein
MSWPWPPSIKGRPPASSQSWTHSRAQGHCTDMFSLTFTSRSHKNSDGVARRVARWARQSRRRVERTGSSLVAGGCPAWLPATRREPHSACGICRDGHEDADVNFGRGRHHPVEPLSKSVGTSSSYCSRETQQGGNVAFGCTRPRRGQLPMSRGTTRATAMVAVPCSTRLVAETTTCAPGQAAFDRSRCCGNARIGQGSNGSRRSQVCQV